MRSPTQRSHLRARSVTAGAIALTAVALSSLLSVNAFPFVTNDGLVYLQHSWNLSGHGLVISGFRQVGYPFLLAFSRSISDVMGSEPLLTTVVIQRLLLIATAALVAWKWRWFAVPLLTFLLVPQTVAYTNFALTEALGLSLAILLAVSVVAYIDGLEKEAGRFTMPLLAAAVVSLAFFLLTIRFTYAVFAAAPIGIAVASRRSPFAKQTMVAVAVFLVLAASFMVRTSMENRVEMGSLSPSAGSGPARFYYAWVQVFSIHGVETADQEGLAEFYGDGRPTGYPNEVKARGLSPSDEQEVFEAAIESMLDRAGRSRTNLRLGSMAWTLLGGRIHDVAANVRDIAASTRSNVDELMISNSVSRNDGIEGFANQFNQGAMPQVVITDPLGKGPDWDAQALLRFLAPASLLIMLLALVMGERGTRIQASIGLAVVVGSAIGLGWVMADNFRFVLASSAFGLAVATALAAQSPSWLTERRR